MVWLEDLFVGESITPRRRRRIIRKVKRRSIFNAAYLLTLASCPDNLIDIIHTGVVRQRGYPRKQLLIIGLAGNYEEALELAGQIISGFYMARGDFGLREYLKRRR